MAVEFAPRHYRVAAVASVLSAITTLLLILMPELFAPGEGLEARIARVTETAYRVRAWAYLVHPFLTTTAAIGAYFALRDGTPGRALAGLGGFLVWGFTEAAQQAWTLVAFDRWRVAWLAGDEAVRAMMPTLVRVHDGVWDAMYLLLLIGFLIGSVAYGTALVRRRGLERAIGVFYFAAAALTMIYLSGEFGGPLPPESWTTWIYLALQPLARVAIGVWLWRVARFVTVATRPVDGR
jgi:hypothetical protein